MDSVHFSPFRNQMCYYLRHSGLWKVPRSVIKREVAMLGMQHRCDVTWRVQPPEACSTCSHFGARLSQCATHFWSLEARPPLFALALSVCTPHLYPRSAHCTCALGLHLHLYFWSADTFRRRILSPAILSVCKYSRSVNTRGLPTLFICEYSSFANTLRLRILSVLRLLSACKLATPQHTHRFCVACNPLWQATRS